METVDDLLDAVKQKHGIKSDYKLAAFTGKTVNTIANYRHGRSRPDDATLFQLAQLAEVKPDEMYILAARFQADRAANDDMRGLWLGIAKRLQAGFANAEIMVLVAILSIAAPALITGFFGFFAPNVCILCLIAGVRLSYKVTVLIARNVKLCNAGLNVPRNQHSGLLIAA